MDWLNCLTVLLWVMCRILLYFVYMLIVSLALCLSLSLFLSICSPCTIFIINKGEEGCVRRNIYYESALP